MRVTTATFRPRFSSPAGRARFGKTSRRLKNSRMLPLSLSLSLSLPSLSFLPIAFLAHAGSGAVARFSSVYCACPRNSRRHDSQQKGNGRWRSASETRDANERARLPRFDDADERTCVPATSSAEHNVASPRHRFARETEREARTARGSPGSRESGEGMAGASEGTRAKPKRERKRKAHVHVGSEIERERSNAFSLDGGKISTRTMETENFDK